MTNTISISIDARRARSAFARAPDVMARAIDVKLARGAEEVARTAKRGAPKAFSNLANSIRAQRIGALNYQVATGMNYGRSVEEGRLPGKQPGVSNGLMEWVKFRTGLSGRPLDRATFAIARSIGRRGIRPQPYMQPAADASRSRLFDLVQQGVDEGIKEIFG